MKKKIILTLFNFCYVFLSGFSDHFGFVSCNCSFISVNHNCNFILQLHILFAVATLYPTICFFFGPTLYQVALNTVYLYLN